MARTLLCSVLLAASVMGTAPAFAACLPVNGLTFEPEPDCTVSPAAPATPAPVAPAAVVAPAPPAASAPSQANVQPPPPPPARDAAEKSDPRATLYRVQRNLSDGFLAMRGGPGGQYDMIARIPSGTEGLSVAECPRSSDGSRPWCRVSWQGKTGWVYYRFIAQQN